MKINRCPKCGRKPCEWINEKDFHAIGYEFSCGGCGFYTGSCKTYEEAVAKWNELTNNFSSCGEGNKTKNKKEN